MTFGFLDSDINALLDACPWFVADADCLLTCIDSGVDTAEMIRYSLALKEVEQLGRFAVLTGEFVLANRGNLFTWFDEFYVFNRDAWRGLTESRWERHYTSDTTRLVEAIPEGLRSVYEWSGALRYASDGDGLNVIATTPLEMARIARALAVSKL